MSLTTIVLQKMGSQIRSLEILKSRIWTRRQQIKNDRRSLTEIFQNGELEQWSDYVADDLIQHNHEIGQGSAAYKNYVAEHGVTFDFVFQLLGQGNYVVSYGQSQIDGLAYAQYDIFRLENGKIVEHWDNKEVMPKVEDLTNRGKF